MSKKLILGAILALIVVSSLPAQTGSPIYIFGDTSQTVRGGAQMERDDDGIAFIWNVGELPRRNAYTTWIVAFNSPENCEVAFACAGGDLSIEAVHASVGYGGGGVSDDYGQVTIGGAAAYDDTSGALFGPGVSNPDAEIHLVLRSHGKAFLNAKKREVQINSFDGGCGSDGSRCADTHAAIFSAIQ